LMAEMLIKNPVPSILEPLAEVAVK
jgi:hypothetical protein